MVAVVVADVTEETRFTYRQPVLDWVKEHFPTVITLDVDSWSEAVLLGHAQQLLQEADFCALFLKTDPKQPLGAATGLVEQLIRKNKTAALCLLGEQPQITSICKARPAIAFFQSTQENDWQPFLASFLENSQKAGK